MTHGAVLNRSAFAEKERAAMDDDQSGKQQAAADTDAQVENKETSLKSSRKAGKKAPGAFRTISEVAAELDVQQHVLRFWETKFSQVRPLKRGGGRRYYRPEDVMLLRRIHHLLYTEGYTIKGVQKLLKGAGRSAAAPGMSSAASASAPASQPGARPGTGDLRADASANASSADASSGVAESAASNKTASPAPMSGQQRLLLENMLSDLKALRSLLRTG